MRESLIYAKLISSENRRCCIINEFEHRLSFVNFIIRKSITVFGSERFGASPDEGPNVNCESQFAIRNQPRVHRSAGESVDEHRLVRSSCARIAQLAAGYRLL